MILDSMSLELTVSREGTYTWMAVRTQVYEGLLWQQLMAEKKLKTGDSLPPVLLLTVYNGEQRWVGPTAVADPDPAELAMRGDRGRRRRGGRIDRGVGMTATPFGAHQRKLGTLSGISSASPHPESPLGKGRTV